MITYITIITGLTSVAIAANCDGVAPACVSVYKGTGCQLFNKETAYKPTCQGNCYVYPVSLNIYSFYCLVIANLLICYSSIP